MVEITSESEFRVLKQYTRARNMAIEAKAIERMRVAEGGKAWPWYSSDAHAYGADFSDVLDVYLTSKIAIRRDVMGSVFVLDVMGPGGISRNVPVDGEAAITLIDFRKAKEKEQDDRNNMYVVEGDVLERRTWDALDEYSQRNSERMNRGFDFIFFRPIGGMDVITPFIAGNTEYRGAKRAIEYHLLRKMLDRLSPDGGMLLFARSYLTDQDLQSLRSTYHSTLSVQVSFNQVRIDLHPKE